MSPHKEIPESRGLFVILLLADMLNTIVREIIVLSNGSPQASATAAIIMFVLIALLFFGLLAIFHFVYLCILKHHYTSFITSSIQSVGALLYFYGDNITLLLGKYSGELGCDEECLSNNRIAASFSLGVALIIFQIIPPVLHKFFKLIHIRGKAKVRKVPNWFAAVDMITVLVKIDTLYSAVVVMVESSSFCSKTDIGTSASFIGICIVIGIVTEIMYCLYALSTNKYGEKIYTALVSIGLVAIAISFPLYILADNHQPLDCAFGCDTLAANTTMNDLTCNQTANSATRLGFTGLTFTLITTISLVYFVCNRYAKEEEIKDSDEIDLPEMITPMSMKQALENDV